MAKIWEDLLIYWVTVPPKGPSADFQTDFSVLTLRVAIKGGVHDSNLAHLLSKKSPQACQLSSVYILGSLNGKQTQYQSLHRCSDVSCLCWCTFMLVHRLGEWEVEDK